MLEKDGDFLSCPLKYALSLLGGKWKALIIWYLATDDKAIRYSDLKRKIPYDISHKVLTQQLKELTRDEVVVRTPIVSERNPNTVNVEYSLTEKGRSLCNIIYLLRDWGMVYGGFDVNERIKRSRGAAYKNMMVYKNDTSSQQRFDTIVWMSQSKQDQRPEKIRALA